MENAVKEISGKQYAILVFIVGMAMKILMLPLLLLKLSGRNGWIAFAIYFALEFASLAAVMIVAKSNPEKNFYEILSEGLGKVFSRITVILFSVFLFAKLCLMTTELRLFLKVTVFENMTWQVYVLPLLAVAFCFGVRSLRGIGRTAEIFAPYIALSVIGISVLVTVNFLPKNILPVLSDGFGGVAQSLNRFPMWFGDFTLLIVFQGKIKSGKNFVPMAMIAAGIAFVSAMYLGLTVFTSYANLPYLMNYGHSISSITQNSTLQSFGRFDLLFLSVWTITIVLSIGATFHFIIDNVEFVIKKKKRMSFSLGLCVLMYVTVIFIFRNETSFFVFATGWFRIFAFAVQLAIPVVLLLSSVISLKKEKKFPTLIAENKENGA